jgi:galactose mutarotase-like enzyme
MIKIDNGILSLTVEEKGAQMRSLCDIESGREYLWQADPEVWGRTAPILFPAVGKMYTDGYVYNGKRYDMPKHGFARDAEFVTDEKREDYLVLVLSHDEKIKAMYPFDFDFTAKFALDGRSLVFAYEIANKGDEPMYFSLGAHPGFNISFGDSVVFGKKESLTALYYNEADRPNADAAPVVLDGEDTLTLTKEFFANGSLCFPPVESESVSLEDSCGKEYMKMTFGKVPHLWLWAKAGAPYVCIEPWYGADETVPVEALSEKKGIVALDGGKTFTFEIKIEV